MSLAISPNPLLLGLYLLRISKALFLGSPSPKTEHTSALISDQVAARGKLLYYIISSLSYQGQAPIALAVCCCDIGTEQSDLEAFEPCFYGLLIRIIFLKFLHSETSIPPLPPLLRPCPGHTGNYTPVPSRRVGSSQMEKSRRLVDRYSNTYLDLQRNIKE